MSESWLDNIISLLVIGGAVILIACGLSIARPNLHGIKFEPGVCVINSASSIQQFSDLPVCSCGKSCSANYPCPNFYGSFRSNTSDLYWEKGTFHKDYPAISAKCLLVPKCDGSYGTNAARVYSYFLMTVVPRVNWDYRYPYLGGYNLTYVNYTDMPLFPCWGYDSAMYFTHKYNALNVYLSLGIPSGCIVLGLVLAACCGDGDNGELVKVIILLPVMLICGIFACLNEIFRFDKCWKSCRRACSRRRTEAPRPRISLTSVTSTRPRVSPLHLRRMSSFESVELSFQDSFRGAIETSRRLRAPSPVPDVLQPRLLGSGMLVDPPPHYTMDPPTTNLPPTYDEAMNFSGPN